jgi:hypothetical protein
MNSLSVSQLHKAKHKILVNKKGDLGFYYFDKLSRKYLLVASISSSKLLN